MAQRWGVAGLGRGASFVQWLNAIDGCEVVAVCDANPNALTRFDAVPTYTDYGKFIDKSTLDAVAVITPGPEHADQALQALERGVHVLSETPCVYSIEEAKAIVDAVTRTGCRYMLAEDYVWLGWTQALRQIVDSGTIGDIVFAEAEYTHDCRGLMLVDSSGNRFPVSAWGSETDLKPTWRASDLPPLFYCSHTLGPLLHLLDDRCVTAVGMNTGAKVAPDVCPTDMESGLLQTEAGRVLRLTNGFCIAHPFYFSIGLYGSRGSVRLVRADGLRATAWVEAEASKGWQPLDISWTDRDDGRLWVSVMLEEFVDALRSDRAPPIDVFRSMEFTLPGICAHMSAERNGQPVQIPDLRQPAH